MAAQLRRLVDGDGAPTDSRTTTSTFALPSRWSPAGWAHYDYVKMPEYRWGIFLAPAEEDPKIGFGDNEGKPVWQDVPGRDAHPAPEAHRHPG